MAIEIDCSPEEGGWRCLVIVSAQASRTTHIVDVAKADLERLDPGAAAPDDLARASFEFLLERESNASILREFELSEIGRYFPEYDQVMRERMAEHQRAG